MPARFEPFGDLFEAGTIGHRKRAEVISNDDGEVPFDV